MLEGYIRSGILWRGAIETAVRQHAQPKLDQGLLANVAPEAVESCEQICSPRRPASPQHLARSTELYGVCDYLMRKVQSVQNAAACLDRYRFKTARSHHSSVARTALPTSTPSTPVQDCLSSPSSTVGPRYLAYDVHLVSEGCRRL